eukprot:4701510-Alexandrium_andersonii.AAC.1
MEVEGLREQVWSLEGRLQRNDQALESARKQRKMYAEKLRETVGEVKQWKARALKAEAALHE